MDYIVHTRYRGEGICGQFNLPAKTVCKEVFGVIYFDDRAVCFSASQTAQKYFSRNDDGCGLERGKLIKEIDKILKKKDGKTAIRWGRVYGDELCKRYRRGEHEGTWLWNCDFFSADIVDLMHIYHLIK